MIFGQGDIKLEYVFNEDNVSSVTISECTCNYDWNIPDILLQKSLNGHVWKVHRGFYHKFTITVYNFTPKQQDMIRLLCLSDGKGYITPHIDNDVNWYQINSVSKPFYVSDINGIQGITITVTTKNYSDLIVKA
jgi:hypothetical protein